MSEGALEESKSKKAKSKAQLFTLKKWNAVAMWSWDVECDTCAICRVQVMGMWDVCVVNGHRKL